MDNTIITSESGVSKPAKRSDSYRDFIEPEEPFQDDNQLLMLAQDEIASMVFPQDDIGAENMLGGEHDKCASDSFLHTDDFELELGSPSEAALSEDFSPVAKFEIVDVVGDDRAGRPIIIIYAYRLPRNDTAGSYFDYEVFLRYLMRTLDKFVNQDYTIVYFHYGLKSYNKPSIQWLVKAYKMLDRRYKKNLKALYLVHPTRFIRIVYNMFKPFISAKFERKLQYINTVTELSEILHGSQLSIPDEILKHDKLLQSSSARKGVVGSLMKKSTSAFELKKPLPTQQFGVPITYVLSQHPGNLIIPPVITNLIEFLKASGLQTEGLFRRSASVAQMKSVQGRLDRGETVLFDKEPNGSHLAAVLLKSYFRQLPEPLLPFSSVLDVAAYCKDTVKVENKVDKARTLIDSLSPEKRAVLQYLLDFLQLVMQNCDVNKMNAGNLALVFGPNLSWPAQDHLNLGHIHSLNSVCYLLLSRYSAIFE